MSSNMKLDAAAAILGVSIDDPVDVLKEAYKKKVIAFDPEAASSSANRESFQNVSIAYSKLVANKAQFDSSIIDASDSESEGEIGTMVTKNGMAVKRNKSEKHCRIYGYNSVHKMSSPCSADNEEQLSQMHFMCMFADLVNIHREEKRKNESNNRDQSQKQNDKEPKVEPHVLEQYNKVKDIALQRFKNEKEMLQSFGALFTNNSSFDSQYLENPTSGCDGRSFHHPSGDRYGARMFDVGEKSDEDGAKCWNKGGDSFDVDLIASQLQNKIFFGQAPYAEPHDATDTSIYVDNNSKSSTKKLKKSVNDAPQINTKAKAKLVATPKDKEVQGTNNSKSASKVDANSKGNSRPEKEEYEPEEDDGNLDPEALKRKMKNFKKNEKRREKKEKALREVREQEEELKRIKQAELKAKQDQEDAVKKCMEETRLFFEAEDKKRSQLFEAIQKGDLDLVKELLSKGQLAPTEREFIKRVPCSNSNPLNSHPNTNVEVTQSGAGLLHMCCTEAFTYADQELVHKKLMIADFLLSLKNPSVDIRILDSNGFNVLNYAVYVQDIGMLQLLLQVKTRENNDHKLHLDVNDKCPSTGWAPLHYAAVYANIDMCKLLLDAGASINNRIIAATEKITLDTTTTKSTIFLHGSTNAKNVIGVNPYELIQYLFQCHSDNRISLSDEEILPLTAVMDEFAIVLKEAELAKQNKDKEKQQRTCEVTTENEKLVEKNRLDAELLEKKQKLLKERRERELKMEAEEEALRKTVKSNVSKVLSGAIPVDGSGGPVSKKKKNKTTETASGSNSQSTNANSACNNNTNPGTNSTASEEQRRINRAWNAKAGGEFKKAEMDRKTKELGQPSPPTPPQIQLQKKLSEDSPPFMSTINPTSLYQGETGVGIGNTMQFNNPNQYSGISYLAPSAPNTTQGQVQESMNTNTSPSSCSARVGGYDSQGNDTGDSNEVLLRMQQQQRMLVLQQRHQQEQLMRHFQQQMLQMNNGAPLSLQQQQLLAKQMQQFSTQIASGAASPHIGSMNNASVNSSPEYNYSMGGHASKPQSSDNGNATTSNYYGTTPTLGVGHQSSLADMLSQSQQANMIGRLQFENSSTRGSSNTSGNLRVHPNTNATANAGLGSTPSQQPSVSRLQTASATGSSSGINNSNNLCSGFVDNLSFSDLINTSSIANASAGQNDLQGHSVGFGGLGLNDFNCWGPKSTSGGLLSSFDAPMSGNSGGLLSSLDAPMSGNSGGLLSSLDAPISSSGGLGLLNDSALGSNRLFSSLDLDSMNSQNQIQNSVGASTSITNANPMDMHNQSTFSMLSSLLDSELSD